jgi:hypothetical protein
MTGKSRLKRGAAAVPFSVIMASVLGFGGFLGGSYLWDRYGGPITDPDDAYAYLCGLLVGGVIAIGASTASL